jgi:Bacterial HORMA domain family 1
MTPMTQSFTYTDTATFTVTHAQHIAAKVATDLKRLQRFYGVPSDEKIEEFERELIVLLKGKYVEKVTYGFKRGEDWIEPTLRYTAQELSGTVGTDDDPGKIKPRANTSGASFYSFLSYTSVYFALTQAERAALGKTLPFIRGEAAEPSVSGYFSNDHIYSAGGRALNRSTVRSVS